MSRTRTELLYERKDELPVPIELYYRQGPGTVSVSGATKSGNTINTVGGSLVNHSVANPSDSVKLTNSQVYTRQVRHRQTGEILGTYSDAYAWTRRSITLARGGPNHTQYVVIHYPYDIEVYNPDNPKP